MPKVPYPYEVNKNLVTGNGPLYQFVPYQTVSIAKFDCTIDFVIQIAYYIHN